MDQQPRRDEIGRSDAGERTVSRRAFFNHARIGLLAVAGVAVFGIATTNSVVTAEEDDEKEKKKGEEATDKDRQVKEKEREGEQKEKKKKKKKKANKDAENTSNTKKKNKAKNGDDTNKKKKKKKKEKSPYGDSVYGKYVEKGGDQFGCTAFPNQFDAQQVLRLEPKDPNNLDGNRNGIACDGQDAFMDSVPGGLMKGPFDLNPVTRPQGK